MSRRALLALASVLGLSLGCGSSDEGAGGSEDVGVDGSSGDTGSDAAKDVGKDGPADAPLDADARDTGAKDAGTDSGVDVSIDSSADADADAGTDAAGDGACPAPGSGTLYVDASSSSGGNGSSICPYVTITAALTAAGPAPTSPITILVAPGTYDATLGEYFPMHVPGNVTVKGDVSKAPTRDSFVIVGQGTVDDPEGVTTTTIELAGTLEFVHAKDTGSADEVVYVAEGTATIRLSTIEGGTSAIRVNARGIGGLGPTLKLENQDVVTGARADGILVYVPTTDVVANVSIRDALIHDNAADGVHVRMGIAPVSVDFGSACAILPSNFVYCNGRYGVETDVGARVTAEAVAWNHATPTSGAAPADVNDTTWVDDTCSNGAAPGACP